MPLNWNLKDVNNYKKLYRKLKEGEEGYSSSENRSRLLHKPQEIIYFTMYIGMREITEKNWEQFYNRVHLHQVIKGTQYYNEVRKKLVPSFITKEDVKRMIGLKTNASSYTKSKFLKLLFSGDYKI